MRASAFKVAAYTKFEEKSASEQKPYQHTRQYLQVHWKSSADQFPRRRSSTWGTWGTHKTVTTPELKLPNCNRMLDWKNGYSNGQSATRGAETIRLYRTCVHYLTQFFSGHGSFQSFLFRNKQKGQQKLYVVPYISCYHGTHILLRQGNKTYKNRNGTCNLGKIKYVMNNQDKCSHLETYIMGTLKLRIVANI